MGFNFTGMAVLKEQKSLKDTIVERTKSGGVVPIISNPYCSNLAFKQGYNNLIQYWGTQLHHLSRSQEGSETENPEAAKPSTDYQRIRQNADWANLLSQITQHESVRLAVNRGSMDELQIKELYLEIVRDGLFFMAENDPAISSTRLREMKEKSSVTVSQLAAEMNYPSTISPVENPLLLLAALPIKIYITTCYHEFLEDALIRAGKQPQTDLCRWHDGLKVIPSVLDSREQFYDPTPDKPLVYHLFGLDKYPASMVIKEDDYFDFLTDLSRDNRGIHPRVSQALTESMLILLGYELVSWEFKVLFRGVIRPRPQTTPQANVAIQMAENDFTREYIKTYLRQARFDVEWENTNDFIQEIYEGCEGG